MLDGIFEVKRGEVAALPALVLVDKEAGKGVAYEGDVEDAEVNRETFLLFPIGTLSNFRFEKMFSRDLICRCFYLLLLCSTRGFFDQGAQRFESLGKLHA